MAFLTVAEAAEKLKVSVATTQRLIRQNRLPHVTLSDRVRRIPEDALVAYMNRRARESVGEAS